MRRETGVVTVTTGGGVFEGSGGLREQPAITEALRNSRAAARERGRVTFINWQRQADCTAGDTRYRRERPDLHGIAYDRIRNVVHPAPHDNRKATGVSKVQVREG